MKTVEDEDALWNSSMESSSKEKIYPFRQTL